MQDMTSTRPIDRSPFDRTIAVWNHKGGTFKTSVVANLGYLFAAGGNKVLLVDMDPQANLDIDFGIPANERERGIGLAEALREGTALPPHSISAKTSTWSVAARPSTSSPTPHP